MTDPFDTYSRHVREWKPQHDAAMGQMREAARLAAPIVAQALAQIAAHVEAYRRTLKARAE